MPPSSAEPPSSPPTRQKSGAGLVVTLESYLASTSLPVPVVIGYIFVVCVLLFHRGIVGEIVPRSGRGRKPS